MANVVYTCQQLGEIGRLGNQLFQAAGTLHRAMTSRRAAIASLHPDWPYRKYFSIPDGCFKPPAEHVGSRPVDCEGYMQDKLMNLADSYLPFEHPNSFYGTLWRWLQPSGFAKLEAAELWRYGEELGRTVAIHVRRGDYLLYPDVFAKLDVDYYKAGLDLLMAQPVKLDQFFLFSDNIEQAMNELDGIGYPLTPIRQPVHPYEDVLTMQFMSRCGAFLIANSTYSWWAARLSIRDLVVMPSRWGMESSPLGVDFQTRAQTLKVSWWKQI